MKRELVYLPVIGAVKGEGAAISTYDVVSGWTYEVGIKYPGFSTAVINIFRPKIARKEGKSN